MNGIELLKATKQSIIHGKWGHGYENHCVLWHARKVYGQNYPYPLSIRAGHMQLIQVLDAACGGDVFLYNDTHTKWDVIAMLGKAIRFLEETE